jgi:hypothetical protein
MCKGVPKKYRIGEEDFIRFHPELAIDNLLDWLALDQGERLVRLVRSGLVTEGWRYCQDHRFFYQVHNQKSYQRKLKADEEMRLYSIELEEQEERDKEAEKKIDRDRRAYRLFLEEQKRLNSDP